MIPLAPLAEDVWLLPGWRNADDQHWMSRWQQRHGYCRLEQHNWQHPLRGDWSVRLQETVLDAPRPVVLVAHGLACILVAWWAAHAGVARDKVRAALLVAPCDTEQAELRAALPGWAPIALARLPFETTVVGSHHDAHCSAARAQAMAQAWGARWMDAAPYGAVDSASALGDWDSGHALLQTL